MKTYKTNTGKMDSFESALNLCSFLTQLLNITRNHEQINVRSRYCEHDRPVFYKSQGPDTAAGRTVKMLFPGSSSKILSCFLEKTIAVKAAY